MPEAEDAQLEIKKRARRRLVGAIALSFFAATVFPLVMDRDPGPLVQDVEIRIPGQDDRTLNTRLALSPPEESNAPAAATPPVAPTEQPAPTANTPAAEPATKPAGAPTAAVAPPTEKTTVKVVETTRHEEPRKEAAKVPEKPADKVVEKPAEKPKAATEKPAEKTGDKANGQFIILIGAFSNEGNVKNLRSKLTEQGIKSFTEPLGDKTRVRAGPFPNREAAEKALQKMKSIGVNGQIAAK